MQKWWTGAARLQSRDTRPPLRMGVGSHVRASLWCGVGMTDDERTSVQAQTAKEAAAKYEAERDAAVAAAQKRLLGGN